MQLSAPNLLSDTGQRKFQIWWWRQIESPSWQTFIRHEWKHCSPKIPSHQSFIVAESPQLIRRAGNLDVASWWTPTHPSWPRSSASSSGKPSLTASDMSDHPTLPVTRSSDEYFLRSTLQTLKDGVQISKAVNLAGFEARLCIWILVPPF